MMQRAVHFPPPGNTTSWAYDWGTWLRADREIRLDSNTPPRRSTAAAPKMTRGPWWFTCHPA